MTTQTHDGSLFENLMDEFLERLRNRESPDPEEYITRHPELATQIREVFPTLHLLEEFGSLPSQRSQAPLSGRLGEFRILREVARGGMGVVYEAVQESLGRHVALKVLGGSGTLAPDREARFQREAQAAARLHHSNIVPVFAVGEHEGTLYYAMQFIQGQTLASVLAELRDPGKQSAPSPTTVTLMGLEADTDFTISTPAPSTLSQRAMSRRTYFANIARIGSQIADALNYAHREGVIHRDLKPGNLLLDANGTPWVTDFGLAKLSSEDGLTQTGAILGTLGYMAPEQFSGEATERSDVYGLGITLYELVTLSPAFRDDNRLRLMDRIRSEIPPAPRSIDLEIPRDLETVILKAIAKEPASRYATAGELSDDLKRFLEGRSVLARRTGWIGQSWRWCKRNRVVATLLIALMTTLATLTIGATVVAVRSDRDAVLANERAWRSKLDEADAVAVSGRLGQRFHALRLVREALADARAMGLSAEDEVQFRSVAASALCRPDLELERTWGEYYPRTFGWERELDFSPMMDEYASVGPEKSVTIRSIADDGILAALPLEKLPAGVLYSPDGSALAVLEGIWSGANKLSVWERTGSGWQKRWTGEGNFSVNFAFSPDSTRLAYLKVILDQVCVVEWATNRNWEHRLLAAIDDRWPVCFSPDGRVTVPEPVREGKRLLAWAVGKDPVTLPIQLVTNPDHVIWDQEGHAVIVATSNRSANAYDSVSGQLLGPTLIHPSAGIITTPVGTYGRFLTCDWTNRLRFWDAPSGGQLFNIPSLGSVIRLGIKGERLAVLSDKPDGKHRLFRIVPGDEYVRIVQPSIGSQLGIGSMDCLFSPADGICLAGLNAMNNQASSAGFTILDQRTGRHLESYTDVPEKPLQFLRDGSFLTVGQAGVSKWPRTVSPQGVTFGPPELMLQNVGKTTFAQSASIADEGRIYAGLSALDARNVRINFDSANLRVIRTPSMIHRIALSPNGQWMMIGPEHHKQLGPNVLIYDLRTGDLVTKLMVEGQTRVGFSPDGQWAWTSGSGGTLRLWKVGTWAPGPVLNGHTLAFTADSQLAATDDGPGVFHLFEPKTGRTIVRIQVPQSDDLWPLAFDPSSGHLAAYCPESWTMVMLDLVKIRQGLSTLGLDWNAPQPNPLPVPTAIHLDAGLEGNRRILANCLRAARFTDAARYLHWILRDAPDNVGTLSDLARLRLIAPIETRDLEDGTRCLTRLMQLVPESFARSNKAKEKSDLQTVYLLRAAAEYRSGHYPDALQLLTTSNAIRPNPSSSHRYLQAMCDQQLGNQAAAKKELAEAIQTAKRELTGLGAMKFTPSIYHLMWQAWNEAIRDEAIALIRKE